MHKNFELFIGALIRYYSGTVAAGLSFDADHHFERGPLNTTYIDPQ